jgi:hypothetical protein
MSSDPSTSTAAGSAERRPAVWPWLLMPFVVLVIYFILQTMTRPPADSTQAGQDTGAGTVEAAPNEATGSP